MVERGGGTAVFSLFRGCWHAESSGAPVSEFHRSPVESRIRLSSVRCFAVGGKQQEIHISRCCLVCVCLDRQCLASNYEIVNLQACELNFGFVLGSIGMDCGPLE